MSFTAMETINLLLNVVDKTMDLIPNYDQRKKSEYRRYKTAYEEEKNKAYPHRDDNLVGVYRDRLLRFIAAFNFEIPRPKV